MKHLIKFLLISALAISAATVSDLTFTKEISRDTVWKYGIMLDDSTMLTPNEATVTLTLKTPPIGFGHAVPVDAMIIIDSSGSMTSSYHVPARIIAARNAAINFIGNMNIDNDRIGYSTFSSDVNIYPLTNDSASLTSSIAGIDPNGWTVWWYAIIKNAQYLSENKRDDVQPVMILLTDGDDRKSLEYFGVDFDSLVSFLENTIDSSIKIYTIGMGDDLEFQDTTELSLVAEKTGGKFFHAPDGSELDAIYNIIAKETFSVLAVQQPDMYMVQEYIPQEIEIIVDSLGWWNEHAENNAIIDLAKKTMGAENTTILKWSVPILSQGELFKVQYKIRSLSSGSKITTNLPGNSLGVSKIGFSDYNSIDTIIYFEGDSVDNTLFVKDKTAGFYFTKDLSTRAEVALHDSIELYEGQTVNTSFNYYPIIVYELDGIKTYNNATCINSVSRPIPWYMSETYYSFTNTSVSITVKAEVEGLATIKAIYNNDTTYQYITVYPHVISGTAPIINSPSAADNDTIDIVLDDSYALDIVISDNDPTDTVFTETWYIDSALMESNTHLYNEEGIHTLRVEVSDGDYITIKEWTVNVAAEVIVPGDSTLKIVSPDNQIRFVDSVGNLVIIEFDSSLVGDSINISFIDSQLDSLVDGIYFTIDPEVNGGAFITIEVPEDLDVNSELRHLTDSGWVALYTTIDTSANTVKAYFPDLTNDAGLFISIPVVEETHAPEIASTTPSENPINITLDDNFIVEIIITDQDSADTNFIQSWYIDDTYIGAYGQYIFSEEGEHTLKVKVSDGINETTEEWTFIVAADTITSGSTITKIVSNDNKIRFIDSLGNSVTIEFDSTHIGDSVSITLNNSQKPGLVDGLDFSMTSSITDGAKITIVMENSIDTNTEFKTGNLFLNTTIDTAENTIAAHISKINGDLGVFIHTPDIEVGTPPSVTSIFSPLDTIDLLLDETFNIDITITDIDTADSVFTQAWYLDGVLLNDSLSQLYNVEGIHTLKVEVSDGVNVTKKEWTINVGADELSEGTTTTKTVSVENKVRFYDANGNFIVIEFDSSHVGDTIAIVLNASDDEKLIDGLDFTITTEITDAATITINSLKDIESNIEFKQGNIIIETVVDTLANTIIAIIPNINGNLGVFKIETATEDNDAQNFTTMLSGNTPNPFNPTTTINYSVKTKVYANIAIFNIRGKMVRTLLSSTIKAGNHSLIWNGRNDNGKSVSSGQYFLRMITNDGYNASKVMILMK